MTEDYDIVDAEDRVVGKATREECHSLGYIHHLVGAFILTSDGKIVLQKRCADVDTHPGMLTYSVVGHVFAGEDLDRAMTREMKEELGIAIGLRKINAFDIFEFPLMHRTTVYIGHSDGPFTKDDTECDEILLMTPRGIRNELKVRPHRYSPGFRKAFRMLWGKLHDPNFNIASTSG